MTRWTFAWLGLGFTLGCSGGAAVDAGDEAALRTDDEAAALEVDGAVRAEWQRTSGSAVKTTRVVDGARRVKNLLTLLEETDDTPACSATRHATSYGMRMGGGRHLPAAVSEAIVLLDEDGESLAKLTLYPCDRTLVTLRRAGGGSVDRFRMKTGFRSAFTPGTDGDEGDD